MTRATPSFFLLTPLLLAALGASACGGVTIDDGETGGGGGTSSSSDTSSTTSDTSSSSDTSSTSSDTSTTSDTGTTTETMCLCTSDADCPDGDVCKDCMCVPGCDPSMGEPCLCVPGETAPCYSGPPETLGVGPCTSGTQVCIGGTQWGPCEGEILPGVEFCGGVDNDCNGVSDNSDPDGDGWTLCDGDCCESLVCSPSPELINPGAHELPDNIIDDDCNAQTPESDPFPDCSGAPLNTPTSSLKLLKAMDLCLFTLEDPPLPNRTWGVISAALTLADGGQITSLSDRQAGVLGDYGPNVLPQQGMTMAALSTGAARDEGDPDHLYPQGAPLSGQTSGYDAQSVAQIPPEFLAPHNGAPPTPCAPCNGPLCATAFDSISLKLRIRTPTNAEGFSFRHKFYTSEAPEHTCTEFNDFFVALLDSKSALIPPDRNIAFDMNANPISVNSALLDVCSSATCASGPMELIGTGMGGHMGALDEGAATSWLTAEAPVIPGETIEIRFQIWDAGDHDHDSLVLLDRFRWLLFDNSGPPPHP